MMRDLEKRNRKIIDAVIEKAETVCPGALALIGVYGSFLTGDIHEQSDLDLLILINDDRGWQLGCTFIQDDLQVGHDLYCTTWESLEEDAKYPHPNIAKLLDAQIVYCPDEANLMRLEELRARVKKRLSQPLTKEDLAAAENMLNEAKRYYAEAMLADELAQVRLQAGGVLYCIENAIAMRNKAVFHRGVKRAYEELDALTVKPEHLCERIEAVASADTVDALKAVLTKLLRETEDMFQRDRAAFYPQKQPVTADAVTGTYEEMFSNWRNKMQLAAKENNRHLAFMSLASTQAMLEDIGAQTDIAEYTAFSGYDPADLVKTAAAYDTMLEAYLQEYRKAGIKVNHYADIDMFVKAYLE